MNDDDKNKNNEIFEQKDSSQEKNIDVKEIAVTVGIYFILTYAFFWIGRNFFDFRVMYDRIEEIKYGYIFDFIKGSLILAVMFIGFYKISLFSLKDKNNIKYSSAIILLVLLFFLFSNIFSEYKNYVEAENYVNHMKQLGYKLNHLPFSYVYFGAFDHAIDFIKFIAFIMALCKIYIKPINVRYETNEDSSEKYLTIDYGIIGYVSCILIFISPLLFIGTVVVLIYYKKKNIL